ncbi:MAG TPA: TetR family transcriptional regulator [Pseudolysinimonas sp.]|nr:TetR family transcriptional regulator [Pseudolysinimonas sp.]
MGTDQSAILGDPKGVASAAIAPRPKGDPDRRLALLNAAIEVVAEKGIEGVTHRAVAIAAGVPLGATTYYFADKDEIIIEAMRLVDERNVAMVKTILRDCLERKLDIVETMIELTEELSVRRTELLIVAYRFSLAPLNRIGLVEASRNVQTHWSSAVEEHVSRLTDVHTARLFLLVLEGIAVRTVSLGERPTRDDIAIFYRRLVTGHVGPGTRE